MKTNYLIAASAVLLLASSCVTTPKSNEQVAQSYLQNLDTTAVRGEDFFQYACGGWMKNNPLTDEYGRFGAFDQLGQKSKNQLKELITTIAKSEQTSGSNGDKIAILYNMAMDSLTLNNGGYAPIKEELDLLANIADTKELMAVVGGLPYGNYFYAFVDADPKQSDVNLFQTFQGGITLGQKEYYLDSDEATTKIRESYKAHIVNMFKLAGFNEAEATAKMQGVLDIETRIAEASFSSTELRVPEANYHKMTVEELKAEIGGIDWDAYLAARGVADITSLNVSQLEPIKAVEKSLEEVSLDSHIAYVQWNLIHTASPYLSDNFSDENFEFFGKTLSGTKANSPRWKRAVNSVDNMLGEAVGELYVEKYFSPEAKERMEKLIANLQIALGEIIAEAQWMDDDTKAKAQEKLDAFYVKVGYPNKWEDYSKLNIANDTYWANVRRAMEFNEEKNIEKAGTKVDKDEWGMTPQTVNAYYNPTTNEICFPAAILQYPFFDMAADDACNYGAIGVVIGHEMTHGFDDQGRQYDKDGNLRAWWGESDVENFNRRAQVMVDFFDNIEVLPGLKANGSFTLGENLADNGGLNVAYRALLNATKEAPLADADGYTFAQRFFFAYAGVWACNIREEQIRKLTMSDPHSLGRWRVNGALPHIDAWYEAFDIKPTDKMYIAPEERVAIWSGR